MSDTPRDRLAQYNSAETLFVQDGKTLCAVAIETGIPESTLKKWSSENNWVAMRGDQKAIAAQVQQGLKAAVTKLKDSAAMDDTGKVAMALMRVKRELERQTDPRKLMLDFGKALVVILENEGHSDEAGLVIEYMSAAADKVAV